MNLAQELFETYNIRVATAKERIYRLVEDVLDDFAAKYGEDFEVAIDRITYDYYDCSIEIYIDSNNAAVIDQIDVSRIIAAGFARVWLHPYRCTVNGTRDWKNCKCVGRTK